MPSGSGGGGGASAGRHSPLSGDAGGAGVSLESLPPPASAAAALACCGLTIRHRHWSPAREHTVTGRQPESTPSLVADPRAHTKTHTFIRVHLQRTKRDVSDQTAISRVLGLFGS